jgi:hypothetical protein
MVLAIDLRRELGVYPKFLSYHAEMGRIPAPEKVGPTNVYSDAQADAIRAFVRGRKKGAHGPRAGDFADTPIRKEGQ